MDFLTINNAEPLEEMTVVGFNDEVVGSKLLNIGIVPGAKIRKMLSSPFGNSFSYKVNGQLIVLRESESGVIFVK